MNRNDAVDILEELKRVRIVAIFRGDYLGRWQDYTGALLAGGIPIMEIALNSPGALKGLDELQRAFGSRILLGVGTALSAADANRAIDAGAQFVIAPDTDEAVIAACLRRHIPVIPGAFTPTEIKRAYELGATMVKLFPAQSPAYIRAVRGPLSHIPLMATGGVSIENAGEYLKAGASALGMGSALTSPRFSLDEITARARQLMETAHTVVPDV
jgi:2-dehydro-3-deoxyphosphogluconate aldolase/(4S)-4-hydroxy-2-oxoglutarate aldolase